MMIQKKHKNVIYIHIGMGIGIIALYVLVKKQIINLIPECVFYRRYNLLCPSCGGTRFIINLFNFKFKEAAMIHPVFFLTLLYLIVLDIIYILNSILNKKIKFFKWWHVVIWGIAMLIYTYIRNKI